MKKNKNHKKISRMKKWMRFHGIFTLVLFVSYVIMGTATNVDLLGKDLKGKYAWAATSISVYVLAIPEKPLAVVTSACSDNSPAVQINWNDAAAADYYDILRDGQMLVSGLDTTTYIDISVAAGTAYTYTVIANGSEGSSQSDDATVTVTECASPVPAPDTKPEAKISIVSFDGKDVRHAMIPVTSNGKPEITGTTNIKNATIKIKIFPGPVFVATIHANRNGYWHYTPQISLGIGGYFLKATTIDPDDQDRQATKNLSFRISSEPSQQENISPEGIPDGNIQTEPSTNETESSFDLIIFTENKNKIVYTGQNLKILIHVDNYQKISSSDVVDAAYEVLDNKGSLVYSTKDSLNLSMNLNEKNLTLPSDLPKGEYSIRLSIQQGKKTFSAQDIFSYKEMPVISLGGGFVFTYSDLVSRLGWLSLLWIIIFAVYGLLFRREYKKYKKSLRHITESDLQGKGLLSDRKGAGR